MSDMRRLAALLAEATPGPWVFNNSTDARGRKGEFRAPDPHNGFMLVGPWINDSDPNLIASAPALAAALVEAADALRYYAEGETDASGKLAQRTLARLVAFDASLKETT